MAKARKTPKPKTPTYERINRDSDSLRVYDVLDETVKKYRDDLKAEDCRIALAWRHGWKRNRDGQLVLGKCKKVSDLDKQFQGQDFVIILNREAWVELDADQRRALVHHELCHAAVSLDQNGNVKKDARNRTMFRVKRHDVEEFGDVILHHGCYKQDLEQFCLAALRSKRPPQPDIPGMEATPAPAAEVGAAEPQPETIPMPSAAKRRPAPKSARARAR